MARRELNPFSLSFLDCMCCGFGAVILLFMIISNQTTEQTRDTSKEEAAEIVRLSARVEVQHDLLAAHEAELDAAQQELLEISRELDLTSRKMQEVAAEAVGARSAAQQIAAAIRREQERRKGTPPTKPHVRRVLNRGNRQYLTGLRMDGKRVMIMVDSSASMLDRTIVNVLIRRNMSPAEQRAAPKWVQVVSTVDWLTANLAPDVQFQAYTFDEQARPLLAGTGGKWMTVRNGKRLDEVMARLREVVPSGGTSLSAAFKAIASMKPPPDDVYLLVDGLPTLGSGPARRRTVSSNQRIKYFDDAVRRLPRGVPVNVILYPFEGDPAAASAFWDFSIRTRGSYLSPSEHWP